MNPVLLLVRHPAVDERYCGRCYGVTDVPLSMAGLARIDELVEEILNRCTPSIVLHTGLVRTRLLAEALAARAGCEMRVELRLRERDFGTWEGQTWDNIYATTGDSMMGLVHDPQHWRPPGGETTYEMRDRVWQWYGSLQPTFNTVAITHGGAIAALLGTLAQRPVEDWLELIPAYGTIIPIVWPDEPVPTR
jgi:broad specificity phosphatase PhoE